MSEYDPRQSPTKPTQTSSYAARQAQRRKQASSPLSTITSMPPSRLILIGAAVLLLVLLLGLLFGRGGNQSASIPDNGTSLSTQATARITPGATMLPAAPVQTQAKVIRLGGGAGRLHEMPLFDSATLSVTLKEGDTVMMLDRTKKDAAGNSWVLVSSGDYVGWIPATNLDTGSTPVSTTPTPTS